MTGLGNEVQARAIAEQVAEAAVQKFAQSNPPATPPKTEIPAPLKWAAGVISAVLIAGAVATANWTVGTLNGLQITVARMDERQQRDETGKRLEKIEERLTRLEQVKQGGRE